MQAADANAQAPYADLTPDAVLDAVEAAGFRSDGRVLALNSYENRVFRIGLEGQPPVVAKFYRPGRWSDPAILEEHAFATELREDAELSVVAPLRIGGATLHHHGRHRLALFPSQGGHAPELDDRATLEHMGRVLARLHATGARRRFVHRPELSIERFGREPVRYLHDAGWLPPQLAGSFQRLAAALLQAVERGFAAAGNVARMRLHGDCHPGNILWRDGQAHMVDLDDCLTGPAMQDLWMFLSGPREEQARQLGWLLDGYRMFGRFDARELHLVEPLRALRLLHYHAWIARRWHDPAFPAAFPWFADLRHWEGVVTQLQEQLAAMDEPPLELANDW